MGKNAVKRKPDTSSQDKKMKKKKNNKDGDKSMETKSTRRQLPKQTDPEMDDDQVLISPDKIVNINQNRNPMINSEISSDSSIQHPQSNVKQLGVKANLISNLDISQVKERLGQGKTIVDQLEEIDAAFSQQLGTELTSPDGIQLGVNADEEKEFDDADNEELDYNDDEEPTPSHAQTEQMASEKGAFDSDSDTIIGDCDLNSTMDTDRIITFKSNNFSVDKKIAEMTPKELAEANPALKALMANMVTKTGQEPQGDTRIVLNCSGQKGELILRENVRSSNVVNYDSTREQGLVPMQTLQQKSPSDTTIYAPALKLTSNKNIIDSSQTLFRTPNVVRNFASDNRSDDTGLIGKNSAFVEQVRVENERPRDWTPRSAVTIPPAEPSTSWDRGGMEPGMAGTL